MLCNESVPIACTLTPESFKIRSQWLQRLAAQALLAHAVEGSNARLLYRPEAADEVARMVAQEQECCGFLHFALARHAGHVELAITAPEPTAADLRALLAHLLPR